MKDLKEQNRLLKIEIELLKRALCKCPRTGDWMLAGVSIFCPVHTMLNGR